MSRRDTAIIWSWRTLIVIFVVGGLVAAIKGSVHAVHPEIVVETCSFLCAIAIVMLEQRARRIGRRRSALEHIVGELKANASALCGGNIVRSSGQVVAELADFRDGLRLYYPRLTTSAATAGLLSGALDGRKDRELTGLLSEWIGSAERCNGKLTMAELLLFFLPASESAMRERLELHVSMLSGPVKTRRAELLALMGRIARWANEGAVPNALAASCRDAVHAVEAFAREYTVVDELESYLEGRT